MAGTVDTADAAKTIENTEKTMQETDETYEQIKCPDSSLKTSKGNL